MKVAVVGSSGYIAGFLLERLSKENDVERIMRIGRGEDVDAVFHLEDVGAFDYDALDGIDYIVVTAAISGPDKCADEFEHCWSVNVTGTEHFIRQALARGCRMLFFSSDAVFGDIPGAIYTEDSATYAKTPYGRMKKAIEDRFKGEAGFKAIRLPYVVSARDRFTSRCLACIESGETVDVFHPFYRNCVVVNDVVNTVMWLLRHWEEYEPFALNVAGQELVSRVRIADELNRIYGGRLHYMVTDPGEAFFQNRSRITQMESLYLDKLHIVENKSFSEKLKEELRDYE